MDFSKDDKATSAELKNNERIIFENSSKVYYSCSQVHSRRGCMECKIFDFNQINILHEKNVISMTLLLSHWNQLYYSFYIYYKYLTLLLLCSYSALTLFLLCSYSALTLLLLCSYSAHALRSDQFYVGCSSGVPALPSTILMSYSWQPFQDYGNFLTRLHTYLLTYSCVS